MRCGQRSTLAYEEHGDRARKREAAELVRVAYVAYTRARERLIITGAVAGATAPIKSDEGRAICLVLPELAVTTDPPAADEDGYVTSAGRDLPSWLRWRLLPAKNWRQSGSSGRESDRGPPLDVPSYVACWKSREERRRLLVRRRPLVSPSALQDQERDARRPPVEDSQDGGEHFDVPLVPVRDLARHLGSLCHEVMEHVDFTSPHAAMEVILEQYRRWEMPILGDLVEEIVAQARTIMSGFFMTDVFERLRTVTVLAMEAPFVMPVGGITGLELEAGVVQGVIDLVYRDPDGAVVVADYKSDHVTPGTLEHKVFAYGQQRHIYTAAVQAALNIPEPPRFELIFLRTGLVVRL